LVGLFGTTVGVDQLRAFEHDPGAGLDALGEPDVAADDRAAADDRVAAEDGGVGVDDDIVLDRRVAFPVPQCGAGIAGQRQRPQGDALVEADVVADDGGLADDDAGAVVDEEAFADGGTRVDVDAGQAVGVFGHDPGGRSAP